MLGINFAWCWFVPAVQYFQVTKTNQTWLGYPNWRICPLKRRSGEGLGLSLRHSHWYAHGFPPFCAYPPAVRPRGPQRGGRILSWCIFRQPSLGWWWEPQKCKAIEDDTDSALLMFLIMFLNTWLYGQLHACALFWCSVQSAAVELA